MLGICGEKLADKHLYIADKENHSTRRGSKPKSATLMQAKRVRWETKWHQDRHDAYQRDVMEKADHLYTTYLLSLNGELQLKILAHEEARQEICHTPEGRNFGILNESSSGCFLNFRKWDLLINDIVFMGAVHAKHTVTVLEPKKTLATESLWDSANSRLRVTGRELVVLKTAAYQLIEYVHDFEDNKEILFVPPEKPTPILTLNAICTAVKVEQAYLHRPRDFDGIWGTGPLMTLHSPNKSPAAPPDLLSPKLSSTDDDDLPIIAETLEISLKMVVPTASIATPRANSSVVNLEKTG